MNVYYLPARHVEMPEPVPTASRWSVVRARGFRAWARLVLTMTEVWSVLRRGGQRPAIEEHIWFADEMPEPRRRPLGPARIIDLDAARRRRAPAAVPAQA